jgi:hypothetical protein
MAVLGTVGLVAATVLTNDVRIVGIVGLITAAVTLLVESWSAMFPAAHRGTATPEAHAGELQGPGIVAWCPFS